MESLKSLEKSILLNECLIKSENKKQAEIIIQQSEYPIQALIAHDLVIKQNFYSNLATVLNIPYISEIENFASGQKTVAQLIPSQLLVKNRIFVYEYKQKLRVVCIDPFGTVENVVEEILSYTPYRNYELVISNPVEIDKALSLAFYREFAIFNIDRVSVYHPEQSTRVYQRLALFRILPVVVAVLLLMWLIVAPTSMIFFMFVFLNSVYFFLNPYRMYIFWRSFYSTKELYITDGDLELINDQELPTYTILVPLKNEADMVPHIIENIYKIDYPQDKLDIKFISEVTDQSTIQALEKYGIGVSSDNASLTGITAQLVKVPVGKISTKPRSCDYALAFARGNYCVIYDAEDKPDIKQLKKIYQGFMKSSLDTVCLQAKLNFYNSRQNILTRMFCLEYGFWYDYYLPGLLETDAPIPLGGTSNHFVTDYLKKIGTWDPYNVTEDADLGIRIYRLGHKTGMLNSYTLEEANAHLGNWIKQRTRWQKGFLLTFLVHLSRPKRLFQSLGLKNFILFVMTFGGNFFLPFLNPFLWFVFIASTFFDINYLGNLASEHPFFWILCVFNFVVGNASFITVHLVSAFRNRRYDLMPFTLLLPFYWILLSVATIRAGYHFVIKPTHWEKTKHGLTKS